MQQERTIVTTDGRAQKETVTLELFEHVVAVEEAAQLESLIHQVASVEELRRETWRQPRRKSSLWNVETGRDEPSGLRRMTMNVAEFVRSVPERVTVGSRRETVVV